MSKLKFVEKLLLEKDIGNKLIWVGATDSQIKSKGLNKDGLIQVNNIIKELTVENFFGSNSGKVYATLNGKLDGLDYSFEVDKKELMILLQQDTLEKGLFLGEYVVYFNGAVHKLIKKGSQDYFHLVKKYTPEIVKASEKTEAEKRNQEAKEQRELTRNRAKNLQKGDIIQVKNSQLIYVGKGFYGYAKNVKKEIRYYAKNQYVFLKKLSNESIFKKYCLVTLDYLPEFEKVDKVELVEIYEDFSGNFGIKWVDKFKDENYSLYVSSDSKDRYRISKIIYPFLRAYSGYYSLSKTKEEAKEKVEQVYTEASFSRGHTDLINTYID